MLLAIEVHVTESYVSFMIFVSPVPHKLRSAPSIVASDGIDWFVEHVNLTPCTW